VRAALVRRHGQVDLAEEAVGDALLAAATQWPREGVPDDPGAWLMTVAQRRLVDQVRSEQARRTREDREAALGPRGGVLATGPEVPGALDESPPTADDTLHMLVLCCHPDLTVATQVALALRVVGGLTTAEIARALLVGEPTVAQRVSRAKKTLRDGHRGFSTLVDADPGEAADRLAAVHHVLYLVFTEGHTATSGDDLVRHDLTARAITLAREVHAARPGDGVSTGLLALMLLTEARTPARSDAAGRLVPLAEQDRTRWDRALVGEGLALTEEALRDRPVGAYQLQAAIAAVHAEATTAEATDWAQIVALYRLLLRAAESPIVRLNLAVAVAMAQGPEAGLAELGSTELAAGLDGHHRFHAVRGHLLAMRGAAGDAGAARASWVRAAELSTSRVESAYLDDLRSGG
jgi:RNA polymerase sigma factor (sigma-70 family)